MWLFLLRNHPKARNMVQQTVQNSGMKREREEKHFAEEKETYVARVLGSFLDRRTLPKLIWPQSAGRRALSVQSLGTNMAVCCQTGNINAPIVNARIL